jgi:hypothetical protein
MVRIVGWSHGVPSLSLLSANKNLALNSILGAAFGGAFFSSR